ncbi:ShlB/FhaC/HecB family hemolysin secretion/activation protein [Pseudanabaena sp. FACHB-1998]|uniref:ShlB/FhaC/HecB family hemolysin secretion/activation protein n=1 Tax=Pseudanabaena sp. FACHB-1998 TaxID=2692858 RepID=UPI0016800CD5|nr:ShlB/FhaC/HecB family hemolysin secretion/activation protein [Pseudanabaena sp. FACHB-1998]MBD2176420.1 ShlB/FhaC/HecB family hemolysin secretion/activation protein [Pseudanabaena sp. FACHB-1998]
MMLRAKSSDKLPKVKYQLSLLLIASIFANSLLILISSSINDSSKEFEAIAQAIPRPTEPSNLPALPDTLPKPQPFPPFQSPPSIPPPPSQLNDSIIPETDVLIREIKVLGSTVFSEAELQQVVKPYLGKNATIQDLLAIRSIITDLYINSGYLTSGAFLPLQAQDFKNGIISIQVIEGELERIDINGLSRLQEDYVRSRMIPAGSRPLNIRNLEEGLQLLQLDPLFSSIQADLKAGRTVGRSVLQIELKENDPWSSSLIVDNRESPSVGSLGVYASLGYRNLTGLGDSLRIDASGTEGTRKYGIQYDLPLNAQDDLQLRYNSNNSRIVEKPFSLIDINSRSQTVAIGYRHFLFRHPTSELSLGLTLERRESNDFLFGNIPFSFSIGSENGRSVVNVLRFSQEWIGRTIDQVLAARSQFNVGLGIFDSTVNNTGTDGRFLSWQGQFQWVQALDKDAISIFRLGAQLTSQSLLPTEQFGLGGVDTIRGYRQSLYVGDSGVSSSMELRFPILRSEAIGLIQVAPFIDFGAVWNNSPNSFAGILGSTGLGLRWEINPNFRAKLEWAAQLVSTNFATNASQPQSLFFSLQITGF